MANKVITSTQNSLVKHLLLLKEKSRERKKSGHFIIEGKREILLAIQGDFTIETLLFCEDVITKNTIDSLLKASNEVIEISKNVYQKLAYRDTTEGVIAIAKIKDLSLKNITFKTKNPIVLVAEAPEKPGNIGALLRTADAANIDVVCIANSKTDIFNHNIIRSSVGCVFTNQIATGTTEEIITFLKSQNINIYCATLQSSIPYHEQDFIKSSAIVVGTESTGLSDEWINNSHQNIKIPMQGKIDSMNVSVAAGILIFEAKRQRNFR